MWLRSRPPAAAWVVTRLLWSERKREPVEPPVQERCATEGMSVHGFSRKELIKLLESNHDLMRCIAPQRQFMVDRSGLSNKSRDA
eukprot:3741624-Pyramimonas_sp.AAC.1